MPSQARRVEPLRPAWPSWMATLALLLPWMKRTIRRQPSTWSSFHRPRQPGVMRASAETQGISPKISPAPPLTRAVVPQAEPAGRNAGIGRDAGHLAEDQPGAAHRPRAEMDQVEIV